MWPFKWQLLGSSFYSSVYRVVQDGSTCNVWICGWNHQDHSNESLFEQLLANTQCLLCCTIRFWSVGKTPKWVHLNENIWAVYSFAVYFFFSALFFFCIPKFVKNFRHCYRHMLILTSSLQFWAVVSFEAPCFVVL